MVRKAPIQRLQCHGTVTRIIVLLLISHCRHGHPGHRAHMLADFLPVAVVIPIGIQPVSRRVLNITHFVQYLLSTGALPFDNECNSRYRLVVRIYNLFGVSRAPEILKAVNQSVKSIPGRRILLNLQPGQGPVRSIACCVCMHVSCRRQHRSHNQCSRYTEVNQLLFHPSCLLV
ncbi:hypothetical protein D3C75_676490 [compost metagenome]